MKLVRKSVNIIFAIILTIIVALLAITQLVDPNRIKLLIVEQVQRQTGYDVAMEGRLSWSFYPRVGIKSERMEIIAPQQRTPFIKMQNVTLGVDFIQLLQGKKNLSGDVHVKKLTFMNLMIENLSADIIWENNVLTVSPFSANLYNGWLSGVLHIYDLNKTPRYDSDVQFNRVQIKPLLTDLNGKENKLDIAGVGQLRIVAQTTGVGKVELLKRLQGKVNYNLSNGVLSGVDLNYIVSTAVNLINKQPVQLPNNTVQTSFESLTGKMKIKNGEATTDDTILVSSAFTVKSVGGIDLVRQVVDFSLDVLPQKLDKFKWGIPVLVEGHLNAPSVKLDMIKINTLIANEKLERLKDKAKEKLKALDLSKDVDNFLQKVLGQ